MEERFDRLEQMLGSFTTRFDSVDEQLKGVNQKFDGVHQKFDDVSQRFDEVNQRIGVLHEDVKTDFRFSLEARQGLKELMEAGFANQERSFREALAPIEDAVRSAHRKP